MQPDPPVQTNSSTELRAHVGGAVFWWFWLLGVLVVVAVCGIAVVYADLLIGILLAMGRSEMEAEWVLQTPTGYVFIGLAFAALLVLLGWAGGRVSQRLRLVSRRWWPPSAVAATFWVFVVAANRVHVYLYALPDWERAGFSYDPTISFMADYYNKRFAQLLLELGIAMAGVAALECGHYWAVRRARTQVHTVAPTADSGLARRAMDVVLAASATPTIATPPVRPAPAPLSQIHSAVPERPRGLWQSLELDRRTNPRIFIIASIVVIGLMLLRTVFETDLVTTDDAVTRAAAFVAVAGLAVYMLLRRNRRATRDISAPGQGIDALDPTQSALDSIMLATGGRMPELRLLGTSGINGHVSGGPNDPIIAVTTLFAELPRSEQEAGLALLLGRGIVLDCGPWELFEPDQSHPGVPSLAPWLEVARRGDREGLRILKDPQPIVRLLERLTESETRVSAARAGEASLYGYLAWPLDTGPGGIDPEEDRLAAVRKIVAAMQRP